MHDGGLDSDQHDLTVNSSLKLFPISIKTSNITQSFFSVSSVSLLLLRVCVLKFVLQSLCDALASVGFPQRTTFISRNFLQFLFLILTAGNPSAVTLSF